MKHIENLNLTSTNEASTYHRIHVCVSFICPIIQAFVPRESGVSSHWEYIFFLSGMHNSQTIQWNSIIIIFPFGLGCLFFHITSIVFKGNHSGRICNFQ